MLTESRSPRSAGIDSKSPLEIVEIMNAEDAGVAAAVRATLPQVAAAVEMIAARLRAGGRLFYIGAGTSGRMGVLDAVECVPTFGVSPELVQGVLAGGEGALVHSVEGAEDRAEMGRADLEARGLTAGDAVVGIAASGRTPYVVGALDYARAVGAGTASIACTTPAPVLDAAAIPIAALVGPEVITGSTRLKAGTAQKMILNMISTATMIQLGKVYDNLMVDVRVSNQKLTDRARRIVMEVTGISAEAADALLAQSDYEARTAIVMAKRGVDAAAARALLAEAGGHLRAVIG